MNDKVGRSLSTCSVAGDLLYFADFGGFVRCLDANSGLEYWAHDTEGHIWGSTLLADGKVYVGNDAGTLTILAAGKTKRALGAFDFKDPIYSTPIVSQGVMYVATSANLYAITR